MIPRQACVPDVVSESSEKFCHLLLEFVTVKLRPEVSSGSAVFLQCLIETVLCGQPE